jgi:hypothetical protein
VFIKCLKYYTIPKNVLQKEIHYCRKNIGYLFFAWNQEKTLKIKTKKLQNGKESRIYELQCSTKNRQIAFNISKKRTKDFFFASFLCCKVILHFYFMFLAI